MGINGWQSTEAGQKLQARLSDEQTVTALTRLLDRIDTLEQTVDRLATMLEQGPGMMSMVTDMADEAYREAGKRGVNVDERLRAGLAIAEKLTAPAMIEKLDTIMSMADQAPGMMSMVTDMADDAIREASAKGINIDERLRNGLEIAEKLTAPPMVAKLNNLMSMADQAPGMMSMVTDMADDAIREASAKGINIDERLRAGLEIAEKLTDPTMVTKLNGLISMADQAPGMMSMVTDMVDDTMRQASINGINIDERLRAGLMIAEKLTAPSMVDKLNSALAMADQGPGLFAMAVDMADETYRQAVANGFELETFVKQGTTITGQMATLLSSEEFLALMESGVFNPKAVSIIGKSADALVETQQQPINKIGIFGLLKAMKDPDMQRALGFLTAFGRRFGQKL